MKIFGIGLNKTGTTTLGHMGRVLGLRGKSCDRDLLMDLVVRKDLTNIRKAVEEYELFEDWPWPLIYEELDQLYPGSKFILTVRKTEEAWLRSIKSHSLRTHPFIHCRKFAYGYSYPHGHEAHYLNFYRTHNDNVRKYFAGRSNDLLKLCWENGDGYEKLCRFLGREVPPGTQVPHANKGSDVKIRKSHFILNRVLRSIS